jgi:hypothetical protein
VEVLDPRHLAASLSADADKLGACQFFEFVGLFVQLVRAAISRDQIALEAQLRSYSDLRVRILYRSRYVLALNLAIGRWDAAKHDSDHRYPFLSFFQQRMQMENCGRGAGEVRPNKACVATRSESSIPHRDHLTCRCLAGQSKSMNAFNWSSLSLRFRGVTR